VTDDWQRRGLGTVLLEVAGARAREEGITTFTTLLLASNQEMPDLLQSLGPVRVVDRERATVEIEMPISEAGVSPALRKLLRVAARHDLAVPIAGPNGLLRLAPRARSPPGAEASDQPASPRRHRTLRGSTLPSKTGLAPRVELSLGEYPAADSRCGQAGGDQPGFGAQAAILVHHSRPHPIVDQLRDRIGVVPPRAGHDRG
jgi:hypothetical protein